MKVKRAGVLIPKTAPPMMLAALPQPHWPAAGGVTGCVVALFLIVIGACSSLDESGEVGRSGSFHYVQRTRMNYDGKVSDTTEEAFYVPPGSVRVVFSNASPIKELISVGSETWVRNLRGWHRTDSESDRTAALAGVDGIERLRDDKGSFEDLGVGPRVAGEYTRRYRRVDRYPNAEEVAADTPIGTGLGNCEELVEAIKDRLKGLETTIEMTIGAETGRIYSLVSTIAGRGVTGRSEWIIDRHNEPIGIEPPSDVLPGQPQNSVDAICPRSG